MATVCLGAFLISWDMHHALLFLWGYMVLIGGSVAVQGALILKDLK
jgi:hypothetical protein